MKNLLAVFALLALLGFASAKTFCLDVWQPVCGINGITYSNSCYANQAHVKIIYDGACRISCFPFFSPSMHKTTRCILISPIMAYRVV